MFFYPLSELLMLLLLGLQLLELLLEGYASCLVANNFLLCPFCFFSCVLDVADDLLLLELTLLLLHPQVQAQMAELDEVVLRVFHHLRVVKRFLGGLPLLTYIVEQLSGVWGWHRP